MAGGVLVLCIVSGCVLIPGGLLFLAYRLHPAAGFILESCMCWQMLATKSLKTESMKVYERLQAEDVEGARKAVSMIVGRDTAALTEEGITKAAVETVAENTSDGVIAPLLYMMLAGGVELTFIRRSILWILWLDTKVRNIKISELAPPNWMILSTTFQQGCLHGLWLQRRR
mgnify:CR=1 FL=1